MVKLPLLWCILSFATAVFGQNVIELDHSNFDGFIANEDLLLVEFYAPWCGHCKSLAPEYELAASVLQNDGIKLAKVDCTVSNDLCQAYEVHGYPTLRIFREGRESTEYKGSHMAERIVKYMQKQAAPAVIELEPDTLDKFKTSDPRAVIVLFASSSSSTTETATRNTFLSVAESMRDDHTFGWVKVHSNSNSNDHDHDDNTSSLSIQEYFGLESFPTLVIYKQFDLEGDHGDSSHVVYRGALDDADSIRQFIQIETVPLFGEVDASSFALYAETGLPLAYLFTDSQAMSASLVTMLKSVAKKYKGRINFVTINATKYGPHAGNVGLQREEWPAFAIQHLDSGHKFPFDQTAVISAEAIEQFVQDYLEGKIKPTLKSEPVPQDNEDAAVKVVVATEFNDIVLDKGKDVFLTVYAPWCEHCKHMASAWEELGELVKRRKLDNKLVIAKMDGTENDIPLEGGFTVDGFPALKLFKAGTNEVVDFDEESRTLEEMIKFLNENNGNGIKLTSTDEAKSTNDEPRTGHDEL